MKVIKYWDGNVVDKKVKLCVLGNGTVGAVAVLSVCDLIKKLSATQIELSCIYDPTIPHVKVGESTTPALVGLLADTIDFNYIEDLKNTNTSLKWGTKYFWKEANNKDFYVCTAAPALHIDSENFNKFVLTRVKKYYFKYFTEIQDCIIGVEQTNTNATVHCKNKSYVYDYIIDCRGKPSSEEFNNGDYSYPTYEHVNSAIVHQEQGTFNESFTSAHIHKNGWMFAIPLQTRKTWGYLYNENLTTETQALKHFLKLKNLTEDKCKKLKWKQYYRKTIYNKRTLFLGNKLLFMDPAGSLPIHYNLLTLQVFLGAVFHPSNATYLNSFEINMNSNHIVSINHIQDLIALTYCGPNNINTRFWKEATNNSRLHLKNSLYFPKWCERIKEYESGEIYGNKLSLNQYWTHGGNYLSHIIQGFNVNLNDFLPGQTKQL